MIFWFFPLLTSLLLVPAWIIGRKRERFYLAEIFVPMTSFVFWMFLSLMEEDGMKKSLLNLTVEPWIVYGECLILGYLKASNVKIKLNPVINRWGYLTVITLSTAAVFFSMNFMPE